MKFNKTQLLAVLIALGLGGEAKANDSNELSKDLNTQIEGLIREGAITFSQESGKAVIHFDVLQKLKQEGKVAVEAADHGQICGGL